MNHNPLGALADGNDSAGRNQSSIYMSLSHIQLYTAQYTCDLRTKIYMQCRYFILYRVVWRV